ncbi:hypothetical protein D3C72_1464910 [compost metagenome]
MHHVHAGLGLQQFARQMQDAAAAGRSVVDLAGLRARRLQQVRHRSIGRVLRHHDHQRRRADDGDRRNVLDRVIRHAFVQAGVDGVVGRHDGQRVAVRLGGYQLPRAGYARRARQIFHDQRLRQGLAQMLGHHAGNHVGGGAGRGRHDQADGTVGVAGRLGEGRGQHGGKRQRTAGQESGGGGHDVSVSSQRGLIAPAWVRAQGHVKGAV